MKKIKYKNFVTVTPPQVSKLLTRPKMRNLFKLMDRLAQVPGFPLNWLVVSIDLSADDGAPRISKGSVNHVDSQAIDIVPLGSDGKVRLPIPLNRNLLLQKIFTVVYSDMKAEGLMMPFIAFEADHLHIDVNQSQRVTRLNITRTFTDKKIHALASRNLILMKALNNRSVEAIN